MCAAVCLFLLLFIHDDHQDGDDHAAAFQSCFTVLFSDYLLLMFGWNCKYS